MPEMLGLFDFGLSPKSPSMMISGCNERTEDSIYSTREKGIEKVHLDVRYHRGLRRRSGRRAVLEEPLEFGNFSVEVRHLFAIDTILYLDPVLQLSAVVDDEASRVALELQAHALYHGILLDAFFT